MRSYRQWCGLACALDVVGERWTLLVIRELFDGPKRYTDLLDGVPGISTDVLAARLRDLEEAGVIGRRQLPPPAGSKVYELTELGEGLAPAMTGLLRWGMQLLGERDEDQAFRPHWLATGLRGLLRPDRARDVTLEIDFDLGQGEIVRVRVADGDVRHVPDPEGEPALVVRAAISTLSAVADGTVPVRDAIDDGRFELVGDDDAVRLYTRLFRPRAATVEPPVRAG